MWKRKGVIKVVFIAERIVNISDLEKLIEYARFNFEVLSDEIAKVEPSSSVIDSATFAVRSSLQKASEFDFLLEKRKCDFTETSGNRKSEGNRLGVCSPD